MGTPLAHPRTLRRSCRRSEIELAAVDAVYEQLEADAMMELLGEMQNELMSEFLSGTMDLAPPAPAAAPASATSKRAPGESEATTSTKKRDRSEDLLWHL